MGWAIKCTNSECDKVTTAANIADLIKGKGYRDDHGWFFCSACGSSGYIRKQFRLQEGDQWEPYLRGIIQPPVYSNQEDGYQPFAFLVSYSPDTPPDDVWFAYYKDLRKQGGRLKMGYGPGGPPVFSAEDVVDIVAQMVTLGCLDADRAVTTIRTTASRS